MHPRRPQEEENLALAATNQELQSALTARDEATLAAAAQRALAQAAQARRLSGVYQVRAWRLGAFVAKEGLQEDL
jgi:hypothetical protein